MPTPAYTYQVPIVETTASYIARVCGNDPYYIAATISNRPEEKNLPFKREPWRSTVFGTGRRPLESVKAIG